MGTYQTEKSHPPLTIETHRVNPTVIQRVSSTITPPERPMHEVTTVSGRTERWPIDKETLETHPQFRPLWEHYQEEKARYDAMSANRMIKAMFLLGTSCELPDNGWEREDRAIGLDVPSDPDEKRAHYLMTHLEPEDIIGLQLQLMKETGVDEKVIQEAEASFRDSLRAEPERAGRVPDAGPDPRQIAQQHMAVQPDVRDRHDSRREGNFG